MLKNLRVYMVSRFQHEVSHTNFSTVEAKLCEDEKFTGNVAHQEWSSIYNNSTKGRHNIDLNKGEPPRTPWQKNQI